MARRTATTIEVEARQDLLSALGALGVDASSLSEHPIVADDGADFTFQVGNQVFVAQVKSVVTSAEAERLASKPRQVDAVIVVADRIAQGARATLRDAGVNFFDRRGELRLVMPPLIIDTRVPGSTIDGTHSSDLFSSQVAKEVAIACLSTPDQPHGVREVATYIDRAPSAVSNAMARFRDAGLLTSKREPAIPDLFQELSVRWRRQPVALVDLPRPGRGGMNSQLELGLDEVESTIGWALTDTVGAAAWDMPLVARGDYPPDFYVPTNAVLRRARSLLGDATEPGQRACTVAVAPVRLACLRRKSVEGEVWPVANHIIVALDIAADRARGTEVLEQWKPKGIVRAW